MKITKKCKLCRAEGKKLFLKGERCNLAKCSITRRPYPPGKSKKVFRNLSDYGQQLRAKQACKRIYGISETQLKKYYQSAAKKKGATGETLLSLLERRLDNVVYRLGFSVSRVSARQIVKHGQILVNAKKVDIPSFLVKNTNKISINPKAEYLTLNKNKSENIPIWLRLDKDGNSGKVLKQPEKGELAIDIDDQLIVEFYSR